MGDGVQALGDFTDGMSLTDQQHPLGALAYAWVGMGLQQ
jgi:hypothetical protein